MWLSSRANPRPEGSGIELSGGEAKAHFALPEAIVYICLALCYLTILQAISWPRIHHHGELCGFRNLSERGLGEGSEYSSPTLAKRSLHRVVLRRLIQHQPNDVPLALLTIYHSRWGGRAGDSADRGLRPYPSRILLFRCSGISITLLVRLGMTAASKSCAWTTSGPFLIATKYRYLAEQMRYSFVAST